MAVNPNESEPKGPGSYRREHHVSKANAGNIYSAQNDKEAVSPAEVQNLIDQLHESPRMPRRRGHRYGNQA